jgi:serine/threonine protein kinase
MNKPSPDLREEASLSVELRVDAACRRFEAAWKAGEQPRPEDFLRGWEGTERSVLLKELILVDMDYRRRLGETVSPDSYLHLTPTSGAVAHRDDFLPRPFGRYTLRKLLGEGGMGRVYLAHDAQLDRLVALKMPNPVVGVAGWRERFLTEARAAATLTHPNVCPVHDVGEVDGQPYLTMAYIEGETLATKLTREGKFAPAPAVELIRTVARAMHEAHLRGIIHRDLKPANLMLDSANRPIVMDFGLAIRSTATDDLRLTLTGVALGTPAYMPPEQAGGDNETISPSSDVYSLGIVLFEMLTGRPPFTAKSFGKLLAKIERDPPPAPSSLNSEVDPALEAVILTALAKLPADRFAGAGDLADALDKYLEGDRDQLISHYSKPYQVPDATSEYRPGSSTATTASFPKRRKRGWQIAGALAFLMAAVAAAVIYVETDYGQLVVQLSDPDAKVDVKVNGQEVTLDPGGGKAIRVRAGANHKLEVSGADFETVAESYEVKRGGVKLARVTLVSKGGVAKVVPLDPRLDDPSKKDLPKPDPVTLESTKKDSPKQVAFPHQSTLIEVADWQILADATKEEMQKWLDARKRDKHSVTWLDSYLVGDKPVFAAVATLDDRQPDWIALPDYPQREIFDAKKFFAVVGDGKNRMVSFSGYTEGSEFRATMLFRPGRKGWIPTPEISGFKLADEIARLEKQGLYPRVIRAYPIGQRSYVFAMYREVLPDAERTVHLIDVDDSALHRFLEENRKKGFRPDVVSAAAVEGTLRFTAVMAPDPTKAIWEFERNLSVDELKRKSLSQIPKGFYPTCVTAYAWDGAVRYCVVWVKEQPKPVEYPQGPTLVEVPGWQILTDATKDEMQKWLDERKKDKHSVTWLDAVQVQDKPVFSAVAALNDSHANWKAFLDLPAESVGNGELFKQIGVKTDHPLAVSGYSEDGKVKSVSLWRHDLLPFYIDPDATLGGLKIADEQLRLASGLVRGIRPYPVGGGIAMGVFGHKALGQKGTHLVNATAEQLAEFLKERKDSGDRITSLVAYSQEGKLLYAIVASSNPDKIEWKLDQGLTALQLKSKTIDLTKAGFRPSCVTAYPWDGAVRYCVVWIK